MLYACCENRRVKLYTPPDNTKHHCAVPKQTQMQPARQLLALHHNAFAAIKQAIQAGNDVAQPVGTAGDGR